MPQRQDCTVPGCIYSSPHTGRCFPHSHSPFLGQVGCCFLTSPTVSDVVRLSNFCQPDAYNVRSNYFYISLISDFAYLLSYCLVSLRGCSSLNRLLAFFLIFLAGLPLPFLLIVKIFIVHYQLVLLQIFSFCCPFVHFVGGLSQDREILNFAGVQAIYLHPDDSFFRSWFRKSSLNVKPIFTNVPTSPACSLPHVF